MKTKILFPLIALIIMTAITTKAQQQPEQLNLPGDNLNLYAVMKLFQESSTLELFEQKLNEENARVNNLDLNGDNYIDYIKVVDYVDNNVHYITLQVAVTPTENQDVAVFVVRKDPNGKVIIQLVGDEELYGKYYIVEPYYGSNSGSTPNPGYYGNNTSQPEPLAVGHVQYVEVESWPVVRLIFLPTYVIWNSPWYWGYYPTYWRPWTPWFWHRYYGYHYCWHDDYYGHYHHGHHNHYDTWHQNYYSHHRKSSTTVYARRERGAYNSTYTKPESLREGTADFRKMHPDKVRSDFREPTLKDIRTTRTDDSQNARMKAPGRNDAKVDGGGSKVRTRQEKTKNDRGYSNEGRKETKPDRVKPSAPENKASGRRTETSEKRRTDAPKQESKPATKERNRTEKQPQKSNNTRDAGGSGRSDKR